MKTSSIFWTAAGALGFLHIHAIAGEWLNIYLSVILTAAVAYLLFKITIVKMDSLSWQINTAFAIVQVLLTIATLFSNHLFIATVLFLSFLLLNYLHLHMGWLVERMKKELHHNEEQRSHINETFRVVRAERHDFLKHVSALHFMLEKNKGMEAKSYLDEIVENYEETNFSIKGERGVIAGVLHHQYKRAKAANISIIYNLDVPLSTIPIRDQKLVELIGNILENAVDASIEYKQKTGNDALVSLQLFKRSGLFMLISKNSTTSVPVHVLDSLFTSYGNTTKRTEDGHMGLGTKIIKDIVKEQQGYLDFVCKDHEFMLKIKIPAIK
ncbi:Sensor histidine kinase DpiB [Bacillus sp. THAF10]|uniref:sensor histidine kinase n=1 Tax=Bacillus sp. THAF10 TaxID=2587848 RepID=UPI0012A803DA|nr:GHKL domain-containing protein [Bacillus sp. THAF10]QFT87787.1 Sensor histidine kinase DpiB [Bacillus sp. THAF10]